ncbi:probable serine/threonine-protein kinase roco6 isoform X3 [Eurosta solidaginis]|uniref:probable serine/threonine-protein kinase roco6 isoform X3 n=1 Tax=Eurosta solidaginis TaxID=178769 RepID=UPI003530971D
MNTIALQGLSKAHTPQHIQYTQPRLSPALRTKNRCRWQNKIVPETKISDLKWIAPIRKWRTNYKLGFNSMVMMTFLFAAIMAAIISQNGVLAAQRDSVKQKNTNKLSSNANAISTESEGVDSIGNGNGNGNAISGSNTNLNRYNNDVSNGNPSKNASATSIGTSKSGNGVGNDTTTSTTVATSIVLSSSSSPVSSGEVQKNSGAYPSGTSVINRNTIELTEDSRNGPYFDKVASKNITALLGKTAYLNCRVKNLGNKTMLLQVSWVRHRDIHLLTVGRYTYTSDQRFRAIHQPQTEDWILQIKYPQHRDSGIYECQVSTTPHMSHYIHLNVVEPSTEIIGAPDLYIESGSTINLTCVILNSPEPPAYIFWNHNNAIINYDSPRGGVSVVTNKGETTSSFLLIKTARPSDSGHYQCNPSNAKPKSVTVHVLNGEFPAAMQRAGPVHHRMSQTHYLLVYLSMYLCTSVYARWYMQPSAPAGTKAASI